MKKIRIFSILFSFILVSNNLLCMRQTIVEIEEKPSSVEDVFNKKIINKKFKVGTTEDKAQKIKDALEHDNNESLKKLIREWAKNECALQEREKEIIPLEKSRNRWCCSCIACCVFPMLYCGVSIVKDYAPIINKLLGR